MSRRTAVFHDAGWLEASPSEPASRGKSWLSGHALTRFLFVYSIPPLLAICAQIKPSSFVFMSRFQRSRTTAAGAVFANRTMALKNN
jgi:hypothetical protein